MVGLWQRATRRTSTVEPVLGKREMSSGCRQPLRRPEAPSSGVPGTRANGEVLGVVGGGGDGARVSCREMVVNDRTL